MSTPEILPTLVTQAQEAVHRELPHCDPQLVLAVLLTLHRTGMLRPRTNDRYKLTQQQRAVLIGAARGETLTRTARRLARYPSTIRSHRLNAYRRLESTSLGPALVVALVSGVITLDEVLPAEHPAFGEAW
ncbi:helix-turn-helix transcriptional regulator [Streptomyces sp. NPDC057877]|uniref:helix-turn-helix transcriptional regulator n=1 Tax=Streptomyces sp. NPDC057877 TaxID=3346269 RepID=UPI003689A192